MIEDEKQVDAYRSLLRELISKGRADQNAFVNATISGASHAQIGHRYGLDEHDTADLVARLLSEVEENSQFEALTQHVASLAEISWSSELGSSNAAYVVPVVETFDSDDGTPIWAALQTHFAQNSQPLLLEGAAGQGKSTFVKELARLAWQSPDAVGLDGPHVSLPIRLRTYTQRPGQSLEDRIWRCVSEFPDLPNAVSEPKRGYLKEWARLSGVPYLVLLDGLDEVDAQQVTEVDELLRAVSRLDARVVITSRPSQVTRKMLQGRVSACKLVGFNAEMVTEFLNARGIEAAAKTKLQAFTAESSVWRTPQILSILCETYSEDAVLPRNEAELFEMHIDVSLATAVERMRTNGAGPQGLLIDRAVLLQALMSTARKMTIAPIEGQALDFGGNVGTLIAAVEEALRVRSGSAPSLTRREIESVARLVLDHTAILSDQTGELEWQHPTFREYLCAQDFLAQHVPQDLLDMTASKRSETLRQASHYLLLSVDSPEAFAGLRDSILETCNPSTLSVLVSACLAGAKISLTEAKAVIRKAVETLLSTSKASECARLLTDSGFESKLLLEALMPALSQDVFADTAKDLVDRLVKKAVEYKQGHDSSALTDLKSLNAIRGLQAVAYAREATDTIRLEALKILAEKGDRQRLLSFVQDRVRTAGASQDALDAAAYALKALRRLDQKLMILKSAQLDNQVWVELVRQLDLSKEDFEYILAHERLEVDVRAVVTAMSNIAEANPEHTLETVKDLSEANQQTLLQILGANSNRDSLYGIVSSGEVPLALRTAALRQYIKCLVTDAGSLLELIADDTAPYMLRRRAAAGLLNRPKEILGIGLLTPEEIAVLQAFFDWEQIKYKPVICRIEAKLLYCQGAYEEACHRYEGLREELDLTSSERFYHQFARLLLERNDEILRTIDADIEKSKSQNALLCIKTLVLSSQGDNEAAFTTLQRVELVPVMMPAWFPAVAINVGVNVRDTEIAEKWEAFITKWKFYYISEEHPDANLLKARAFLRFRQGRTNRASEFAQEALKAGNVEEVHLQDCAKLLRACQAYDAAEQACERIVAQNQDDLNHLSERVGSLLALGRTGEAARDLAQCRKVCERLAIEDPFFSYQALQIEGVNIGLTDDLSSRFGRLAEDFPCHTDDLIGAIGRSNRALCHLIAGNTKRANGYLLKLAQGEQFHQLEFYTLPNLRLIARLFPSVVGVPEAIGWVEALLWPEGTGKDEAGTEILRSLEACKRVDYAFPMYCRLHSIGGLEDDRRVAEKILNHTDKRVRTAVIWTLDEATNIYGQCNFKRSAEDVSDFKFSDTRNKLIETLPTLISILRLRRLVFAETELFQQLKDEIQFKSIPVSCTLIERFDELSQ